MVTRAPTTYSELVRALAFVLAVLVVSVLASSGSTARAQCFPSVRYEGTTYFLSFFSPPELRRGRALPVEGVLPGCNDVVLHGPEGIIPTPREPDWPVQVLAIAGVDPRVAVMAPSATAPSVTEPPLLAPGRCRGIARRGLARCLLQPLVFAGRTYTKAALGPRFTAGARLGLALRPRRGPYPAVTVEVAQIEGVDPGVALLSVRDQRVVYVALDACRADLSPTLDGCLPSSRS